jgi:hypothetical protein
MTGPARQACGETCLQIPRQSPVNALDAGPIHAGSPEIVFRNNGESGCGTLTIVDDGSIVDDCNRVIDVPAAAIVASPRTKAIAIGRPADIA